MTSATVSTPVQQPALWRKIAFYVPVVLFVALLVVFTGVFIPALPYIFIGWATPASEFVHHVHEFLSSIFFWSLLVGVGVQLYRPLTKAAPILQVVSATSLLVIVALLTNSFFPPLAIFLALGLLVFAFHPLGIKGLFAREGGVHLPLLALTLIALVPALLYAADHIGLQAMQMPGDEHGEFFHWGSSATIALCGVAFALLAALRFSGWKITAWSAGAIGLILGLTGILFPSQASSVGPVWGVLTLIWGAAVIAAAHFLAPSLKRSA